jgi:hypothetical protein
VWRCDVIASTQKPEHRATDDWNNAGDLCSDFGGKEGKLVPRQKVAAESETDYDEQ